MFKHKGDVQSAKRKISCEETAINNFVVSFRGQLFMATVEIWTRLYIYTASCTRGHYNFQTWFDPGPCPPFWKIKKCFLWSILLKQTIKKTKTFRLRNKGSYYVSPPFWRVLHHLDETFQGSCTHKRNEVICKISTKVDGIKSLTLDQSCWTSKCSSF